jgi:hypothetical protein
VVERDGLENRCTGNRTEGSNPSLSAKIYRIFSHLVNARAFIKFGIESLDQRARKPIANRKLPELFS